MFNFSLAILNPFNNTGFKNIFRRERQFSIYKAYCLEIYKCNYLFSISFNWSIREDHAGIILTFGLFGYEVNLQIYDVRHWDHEYNCWKEYDENI
jgi:hypothetical protein